MAGDNMSGQGFGGAVSQALSDLFTKAVVAIIILLLGFIIGRIAGKLLLRFLHDLKVNAFLRRHLGISLFMEEVISTIVSYGIYGLTVLKALNYVGITLVVVNLIAALSIFIIVLFIILAIKDFVPNLFVGIFVHARHRISEGSTLSIKNTSGQILTAGLLETVIKTSRGERIIIPNVLFLHENYSVKKR